MDIVKKLIPIILIVIMLVLLGFIWNLNNKYQALNAEKSKLEEDNQRLVRVRQELQNKISSLEKEIEELLAKRTELERQLEEAQAEKEKLESRYRELLRERDELVEKLKSQPKVVVSERIPTKEETQADKVSEEYWVDFVKIKAELEAKNEALNKELLDAKTKIADLDKTNKELSIKIDELKKEKERLDNELNFKERTLSILSRDLVSEREARRLAVEELNKLRSENISLKRELILANKEKMRLQEDMKMMLDKKNDLEKRIAEIDKILREKAITLEELQEQMKTAVKGAKPTVTADKASVELPPIVVRPQAGGLKNIRGEVIAVNEEEKFIIVSLGETAGLRVGMQLAVMRDNREIALAEVIETRKEISAADIKELVSGYSIQKGDVVIVK